MKIKVVYENYKETISEVSIDLNENQKQVIKFTKVLSGDMMKDALQIDLLDNSIVEEPETLITLLNEEDEIENPTEPTDPTVEDPTEEPSDPTGSDDKSDEGTNENNNQVGEYRVISSQTFLKSELIDYIELLNALNKQLNE